MQLSSEKELKWGNKFTNQKTLFDLPSFGEVIGMIPMESRPEIMERVLQDSEVAAIFNQIRQLEASNNGYFIDEAFDAIRQELFDPLIEQVGEPASTINLQRTGNLPQDHKFDFSQWLDLTQATQQVATEVAQQLRIYPSRFENEVRIRHPEYYSLYSELKRLAKRKVKEILKQEKIESKGTLKEKLLAMKDEFAMWLLRAGR